MLAVLILIVLLAFVFLLVCLYKFCTDRLILREVITIPGAIAADESHHRNSWNRS
jgi:hypothetical protein